MMQGRGIEIDRVYFLQEGQRKKSLIISKKYETNNHYFFLLRKDLPGSENSNCNDPNTEVCWQV